MVRLVGLTPLGQVAGTAVCEIAHGEPAVEGRTHAYAFSTLTHDCPTLAQSLVAGRRRAVERLGAAARSRGAHGILAMGTVARRLRWHIPTGQALLREVVEYTVIGTAVAVPGEPPPDRPFISHLSGQDVAKLLLIGLVPCGLVHGAGAVVTGAPVNAAGQRPGYSSWEVANWTGAMGAARSLALADLAEQVRAVGGDAAIGVEIAEREIPFLDRHLLEVVVTATATTHFRTDLRPPSASTVLTLR